MTPAFPVSALVAILASVALPGHVRYAAAQDSGRPPVAPASAQTTPQAPAPETASVQRPAAPTPVPAAWEVAKRESRVRDRIAAVREDPNAVPLPPNERITTGPRTIPAGQSVPGDVATIGGPLDVFGSVSGNAIAIDGDVVVHPGAVVGGSAFSVGGRVRADGLVRGEIRTIDGPVGRVAKAAEREEAPSTAHALKLAFGWLVVLILIGLGVLVAASDYLDGVVDALEDSFSRAMLVGLAGQLAILPVLVLGVVALAITILGIVLIPVAAVAYALALAGLVTLGFLAIAQVTGRSLRPVPRGALISARGEALRALVIGISAYLLLWIVAAAFTWHPVVGGLLRAVAFTLTWVAVTAGFGATLISRAGTRRVAPPGSAPKPPEDDLSWMTPTPVTGVVAARRPTPVALNEPR